MGRFAISQYADLLRDLKRADIVLMRDFAVNEGACVAIRHDIDNLQGVDRMAEIEIQHNIRSTYYVRSIFLQNEDLISTLKVLQHYGFEIGLHNDCLSRANGDMQMGYYYLTSALREMQRLGFAVAGIANHGDGKLRSMGKNNNDIIFAPHFKIRKMYEAYHINYTCYLRDIGLPNSLQLCHGNIHLYPNTQEYKEAVVIGEIYDKIKSEKTEVLIHPQHWE